MINVKITISIKFTHMPIDFLLQTAKSCTNSHIFKEYLNDLRKKSFFISKCALIVSLGIKILLKAQNMGIFQK